MHVDVVSSAVQTPGEEEREKGWGSLVYLLDISRTYPLCSSPQHRATSSSASATAALHSQFTHVNGLNPTPGVWLLLALHEDNTVPLLI